MQSFNVSHNVTEVFKKLEPHQLPISIRYHGTGHSCTKHSNLKKWSKVTDEELSV